MSVSPVELRVVGTDLTVTSVLGEHPATGDAHEATLSWALRTDARTLGLDAAEAQARHLFYAKR